MVKIERITNIKEFQKMRVEQLYKYQKMIQGETELNELFDLIKTRPLDALRGFFLHPIFITRYLLKNYILRMKK